MTKSVFITGTEVTANTNVPLRMVFTDGKTLVTSDNNLRFSRGLYKLTANLTVTGVAAGNVTAQIYRNGVAVTDAVASATVAATTDLVTLPLQDAFRVIPSTLLNNAEISIRLDVDAIPTGGNVITEYL